MKKTRLKDLLQTLSLEEQKEIILANQAWLLADCKRMAQEGHPRITWDFYYEHLEGIKRLKRGLDESIAQNCNLGFKDTIVPYFRDLPEMARDFPEFNSVMRDNLPPRVFRMYYEAAGLDVDQLEYADYE